MTMSSGATAPTVLTACPRATRSTLLVSTLLVVALAAAAPAAAGAQVTVDVGHTPAESPFRDLLWRQGWSVIGGYYAAASDVAGVAPRSGPMIGARYDIRIAGPANFYARIAGVSSERRVINPAALPEARDQGVQSLTLGLADIGVSLDLTGQKSWNRLVPVVAAGLGIASDFESEDVGGYKFGTPFALSVGAGVRYVPGGRFQLRVDVTDHFYQIRYPSSYYQSSAPTVEPVLEATQKQNVWKHNAALTIGVSYMLGR